MSAMPYSPVIDRPACGARCGAVRSLVSDLKSFVSLLVMLVALTAARSAQAQAPEAEAGGIEAAPSPESTGLGTAVTPLPDEDVMRPTRSGLQFTPSLARAFALGWINQNIGDRVDLSSDQLSRFSENIAERSMRMAKDDPQVTRDALEGLFESVIVRGPRDKLDAETAQKTAHRMRPVISQWHELLDGIAQDGEPILTPEQQAEVKKAVERRHRRLDQLDEMMERWSRGEPRETDRLDRMLDPNVSDDEMEVPPGAPQHPGYPRARRRAGWQTRRIGPVEWLQFMTVVKSSLHFDAQQIAKADAIYADYKSRAAAVMTREWREKLHENRTRSELRWELKDLPSEPWLFHLEQEYKAMIKPIEALKAKFQPEILALATDAQREAFVGELRERFGAHGLVMNDTDRAAILALLR